MIYLKNLQLMKVSVGLTRPKVPVRNPLAEMGSQHIFLLCILSFILLVCVCDALFLGV